MVLVALKTNTGLMVRLSLIHGLIDLVERKPELYLALITRKDCFAIPGKEVNKLAIAP